MNYYLPVSVEIGGKLYAIRNKGDWRVILDVIAALTDPDLTERERLTAALIIFFEEAEDQEAPANLQEAVRQMSWFIDGGEESNTDRQPPRLMDWEQDFKLIVAPVSRIVGSDIRALPYLHWWSFLSAYMEIGECTFATIVSIRNKLNRGKKLEKWEQAYLREHADTVRLKHKVSSAEQAYLDGFVE